MNDSGESSAAVEPTRSRPKSRLIFVFLDGVGIGPSSDDNPFFQAQCEYFPLYGTTPAWPDGTPVESIDPMMGVEGLPQSATGQTTLFTGINVPDLLKRHHGGYPDKTMRRVIKNDNLLIGLQKQGLKVAFLNAYPVHHHFFTPPHLDVSTDGRLLFSRQFPESFKRRISVTTCLMVTSGLTPFNEEHLRRHEALFQDFSNRYLIDRGLDVPEVSPQRAAHIISRQSGRFDFLLYEFFQTDLFAHRKSIDQAVTLIRDLNILIQRLLSQLNRERDTLIITSDHGNLEDFSTRSHTRNPVPLIVWGQGADHLRGRIRHIGEVTPAILRWKGRRDK